MKRTLLLLLFSLLVSLSNYTAWGQQGQDTLFYTLRQELFYKKGQEQLDKKNYKDAIKYFNQAIELNKKYAEAYYSRGSCYFLKKVFKKALEDYEMAIYLKPKDSEYYNAIGELYGEMKNMEEAMMNINKAIKYDSLNGAAWNNRAIIFSDRGEYIKAEHDFLKAIKYGKKKYIGMSYTNLGAIYIEMKKYESAIEELTHAIELNWTDKNTYLYRARAYDALGKTKEAEEDRKKAKEFKREKQFN